jgi:hypothetical protein
LELNCSGNRVRTDWPLTGRTAGQASSSSFGRILVPMTHKTKPTACSVLTQPTARSTNCS